MLNWYRDPDYERHMNAEQIGTSQLLRQFSGCTAAQLALALRLPMHHVNKKQPGATRLQLETIHI
jgi:hypothetical protein